MTFHPDSLPDLSGKVYIVTGGTGGIGYYTVARLAQHGAHVYLCARSEAKGRKAVEDILTLYPGSKISFLVMEHTSLSSVVSAAKLFISKEAMLHGLVNNAGVIALPWEMTADDYEVQWQTNYIAHWVFTEHLTPLMLETSKNLPAGTVRIVNLTSGGNLMAPKSGINFSDTTLANESAVTRYGQSKLANILHARTLDKKYGPGSSERVKSTDGEIWTSSIHPGLVQTGLDAKGSHQFPWFMKAATFIINATGGRWPPDKGAWTSVFCVASPEMKAEQSGAYFERIAKQPGMFESSMSKDMKLAEELEEWTRKEMTAKGWI